MSSKQIPGILICIRLHSLDKLGNAWTRPPRATTDNKQSISSPPQSFSSPLPHTVRPILAQSTLALTVASTMSTPLLNVDTNPRQARITISKDGSKIPNPPKWPRGLVADRRNIFSVSATGSPCYTTIPSPTRTTISPTPVSRLPRKLTPTQGATSKSCESSTKTVIPHTGASSTRGNDQLIDVSAPPNSVSSLV